MRFRDFMTSTETQQFESIKARIPLDPEIFILKRLFNKAGYDLVVAGGAVRDYLFHAYEGHDSEYHPKDTDLATDAPPQFIIDILNGKDAQEKGICFIPIGQAFGVIQAQVPRFLPDGKVEWMKYEIATFREDSEESDGRRPESVTFSNREADAKRRDLTMNALYYEIPRSHDGIGAILDYNHGQGLQDIKNKLARPVGDPSQRFEEDKLRVLRLVRFFCRYNNGGPEEIENKDPHTAKALKKFHMMDGVSPERIEKEFLMGLESAKDTVNYLKILHHFNLFDRIFQNLKINTKFERLHSLKSNKKFYHSPNLVIAWLLLYNDSDKVAVELNKLKYPNKGGTGSQFKIVENVKFLIDLATTFKPNHIYHFSKERDKLRPHIGENKFKPAQIEAHNAEVMAWANLVGLDRNMISHFLKFERTVHANDARLTGKHGPALGKAINDLEVRNFMKMIGEK